MKPWLFLVALGAIAAPAHADAPSNLREEASALAGEFIGQLKPQLKAAMAEGGPVLAIEVCATSAPAIADALSASSGWHVRRVSLRQRNASRAVPDAWEQTVLEVFDRRQASGDPASTLLQVDWQPVRYRFKQAQETGAICLACHGENLAPEVTAALNEYYPQDLARGYQLGQVRGAISLIKTLQQDCGPEVEC